MLRIKQVFMSVVAILILVQRDSFGTSGQRSSSA